MTCKEHIIGETGLQFFGKISASISHEIKNALAIINENAGLLEDYTLMSEKGIPLDPIRLKLLAENISKQIQRANGIIKNMNAFAHSADAPIKKINFCELIDLVIALSGRFAAMRNIVIEITHPEKPIFITINPFLLETLASLCLNAAMDAAGKGKTVNIATEKTEKHIRLTFNHLANLSELLKIFPAEREQALLETLNAKIITDVNVGKFVLEMETEK